MKFFSYILFFTAFVSTWPYLIAEAEEVGDSSLSPFEKAELKRLFNMEFRDLGMVPIRSVLGYDQEYWRNPASVDVIRPDDISLNGHLLTVDSFRQVAGMYVSRGVGYDDFVTMRNFSGSATEKFLTMVDGREVLQIMGGTINWTTEDVPLAILDRVEIIRGPGASIWGTNAVSGVINVVTKHAASTQGNSVRLVLEHDGTFLGEYVHGGKIGDDSYYRVWARDQEYAEGELMSGLPARDDGYARKAGFRFDKNLGRDLDFTFAGGFATRRVDHVLDLSYRLLYPTDASFNFIPISEAITRGLPGTPDPATHFPTWPTANGVTYPSGTARIDNYEKMPQDGSHLRTKLSGVTDSDMEWSLAGYAELYDTSLGHIGHSWERREYDLDFRANRPWGNVHHFSFGFSFRHSSFKVDEVVTDPWAFNAIDLDLGIPSSTIPIIDYGGSPTKFERINGFLQDSIELTDDLVFSIGTKLEDSDLSGSSVQPGARVSYSLDQSNILWGAYSRAYRQASLVEKFTKVSYARIWNPLAFHPTLNPTGQQWVNLSFSGDPALHDEQMDAFEIGWRSRPSEDLLIELSLYRYDTHDAVFSGPPIYSTSDVETTGGELTFDYQVSDVWNLQGGYSYSRGKKDGVVQDDFPESMASLSSHFKLRDNLTLSKNLYYTADRVIPSAYNEIPIDDYLRLDLGLIWRPDDDWEIGFFGRDLLDPGHPENMYNDLDVEPGKVERTFLLSIFKDF